MAGGSDATDHAENLHNRGRCALIGTARRLLRTSWDEYIQTNGWSYTTAAAVIRDHGLDPAAVLRRKLNTEDVAVIEQLWLGYAGTLAEEAQ